MFKPILTCLAPAALIAAALTALPAAADDLTVGPVAKVTVSIAPELVAKTKDFSASDLRGLEADLRQAVEDQLKKKGALTASGGTLDLVIDDLKPTRPTFRQMSEKPSLSFESFALGGMALTGSYRAPNGKTLPISYDWYETDIRDSQYGWTWSGATRGFNTFARSLKAG